MTTFPQSHTAFSFAEACDPRRSHGPPRRVSDSPVQVASWVQATLTRTSGPSASYR